MYFARFFLSALGKGYQVLYEDSDGVLHSMGYGPEATSRTFLQTTIVAPSATSTATQL
jgi:hypothetical protein